MKETAICIYCRKEKALDRFPPHPKHKNGRQSSCRVCDNKGKINRYRLDGGEKVAWNNRKYRYGITKDGFMKLKEKQFGLCIICCEKLPEDRKIHVDHDHYTGEVRGLLCPRCNLAVGIFENNKDLIGNIVDYLE